MQHFITPLQVLANGVGHVSCTLHAFQHPCILFMQMMLSACSWKHSALKHSIRVQACRRD